MPQDQAPLLQEDPQYTDLRKQGMSKEKAARIAAANRRAAARPGNQSPPYEDWSREELYVRARDLRIAYRSQMSKGELIEALRERRRQLTGAASTTRCGLGSR